MEKLNQLQICNNVFAQHQMNGVRLCFESAMWNSTDGQVKTYFHIHVQHDRLPDFNSGIGDSTMEGLIKKIESNVIPELQIALGTKKRVGG